jgi:hypothetical protein
MGPYAWLRRRRLSRSAGRRPVLVRARCCLCGADLGDAGCWDDGNALVSEHVGAQHMDQWPYENRAIGAVTRVSALPPSARVRRD